MRRTKLFFALALALVGASPWSISGCGGAAVNVGDSHVGKEELYKTGNFDFDEFFEDVYGLQGSAKAIVSDEKAARAPLGLALGIGETSIDRMLEVLRDKAEEFAQSKNRVHFAIDGVDDEGKPLAGKQIEVAPSAAKGRSVPKDASEFAAALQQMAEKEGQVWEKYAPLPDRSKRLAEKSGALQGSIDKDLASLPREKRDEVLRELRSAKVVSEQIGDLSDKVVANAVKFIKRSGELLTAAANAEIKPPEKTAKGAKSKPPAPAITSKDAPKPKDPQKAAQVDKPAPPTKSAPPTKLAPPTKSAAPAEGGGDFNP